MTNDPLQRALKLAAEIRKATGELRPEDILLPPKPLIPPPPAEISVPFAALPPTNTPKPKKPSMSEFLGLG